MEMSQHAVNQVNDSEERASPKLWQRRDIWQITLLFVVAYIFGSAALGFIPGMSLESDLFNISVLAVSAIAGCGAVLLINRLRPRHGWHRLGFIPFNRQWLAIGTGFAVVLVVARTLLLGRPPIPL